MELFYSALIEDDRFHLSEEEARHILKVLRHRAGDEIMVTDGKGNLYSTSIESIDQKNCVLKIRSMQSFNSTAPELHLAVAPTKNTDRFEWFLEKATEIGIDFITPLLCQRSERKTMREDRLQKVMVAAMKQSLKFTLPVLNPPRSFSELIQFSGTTQRFICSMDAESTLIEKYQKGKDCMILIGPEGDFTEEEIQMAVAKGFLTVSLGESRLRTETAAIMACCAISLLNQDRRAG
jgi:16S rRNA (uracil1498-N3)-methyltransferase